MERNVTCDMSLKGPSDHTKLNLQGSLGGLRWRDWIIFHKKGMVNLDWLPVGQEKLGALD